jgi:hypothetical membrane protein
VTRINPDAIIAEGVRAAARQQRTRNLILGTILIIAGLAFGAIGIYAVATPDVHTVAELVFAFFGFSLSCLGTGVIKLWRGLSAL